MLLSDITTTEYFEIRHLYADRHMASRDIASLYRIPERLVNAIIDGINPADFITTDLTSTHQRAGAHAISTATSAETVQPPRFQRHG